MSVEKQVVQTHLATQKAAAEASRRAEVRAGAAAWLARWNPDDPTLPPGVQSNPDECVFAHALGGSFTQAEWELPEDRLAKLLGYDQVTLPPVVQEFIERFDNGEYPDLIDRAHYDEMEAD